jgi:hypothetical protein
LLTFFWPTSTRCMRLKICEPCSLTLPFSETHNS